MLGRASYTGGTLDVEVLGFDHLGLRVRNVLMLLSLHAVLLAPAWAIARVCKPGVVSWLVGLGAGAATAALLWHVVHPSAWPFFILPLPLEAAAIAVWAARRLAGSRATGDTGLAGTLLAVSVFAVALLGKIALNTSVMHYGFVLAMPATLLAVFVAAHQRIESGYLAAKVHQVGAGPDRFRPDRRGMSINAAVAAIRSRSHAGSTLFVVPEGAMINYLARRQSPVPFLGFLPNGFVEEPTVVRALLARPPDLIAITDRNVAEFGVGPHGRGHGKEVMAVIERDYRSIGQFGPSPLVPGGNGIQVLARSADAP